MSLRKTINHLNDMTYAIKRNAEMVGHVDLKTVRLFANLLIEGAELLLKQIDAYETSNKGELDGRN